MCVPLDRVTTPVAGALDAVRWCKAKGLAVVLVSNTLSRGDEESWFDVQRLGLADVVDAVVTSHSVGWQKPHRRIFERALKLADLRTDESDQAVMVGDRLLADIWGAKRIGYCGFSCRYQPCRWARVIRDHLLQPTLAAIIPRGLIFASTRLH